MENTMQCNVVYSGHGQNVALAYCSTNHVCSDGTVAGYAVAGTACRGGRLLRSERRKGKERRKVGEMKTNDWTKVEKSDVKR
jgi:hypothetical protein